MHPAQCIIANALTDNGSVTISRLLGSNPGRSIEQFDSQDRCLGNSRSYIRQHDRKSASNGRLGHSTLALLCFLRRFDRRPALLLGFGNSPSACSAQFATLFRSGSDRLRDSGRPATTRRRCAASTGQQYSGLLKLCDLFVNLANYVLEHAYLVELSLTGKSK